MGLSVKQDQLSALQTFHQTFITQLFNVISCREVPFILRYEVFLLSVNMCRLPEK